MATTRKVLGQQAPGATTETDLYTVPALTSTVCSTVTVCNRAATAATFRVSVSVGGGVTATKDYIYFDVTIAGNDTFAFTFGATLAATDKVRVYGSTANLSFNLFGQETS